MGNNPRSDGRRSVRELPEYVQLRGWDKTKKQIGNELISGKYPVIEIGGDRFFDPSEVDQEIQRRLGSGGRARTLYLEDGEWLNSFQCMKVWYCSGRTAEQILSAAVRQGSLQARLIGNELFGRRDWVEAFRPYLTDAAFD